MKKPPLDKASASEIPIKILEESKFCFPELTNCINEYKQQTLTNNKLPDISKLYEITIVFKKLNPSDKANYKPV